jgi:hypothetical protein
MKLRAGAPGIPASPNGRYPPGSDISVSHATRYLSAAAHLRRSMFSGTIKDPDLQAARPPLAVGRKYARRVLRGAEGVVPVSAVHLDEVEKQCRIAFWQTVIRDAAAIAAVIISAILQPWGTIVTLGLLVGAVVLVGRVRLFSPATIAVAIGVTLALFEGGARRQLSLAIPLICLAACFVIYLADILLCAHHVRKIWRRSTPKESPPDLESSISASAVGPLTDTAYQPSPQMSANGRGNGRTGLTAPANGHRTLPVSGPERAYYDKHGIVGAGTAWQRLTFTVPLDKPIKDRDIRGFSASELLGYIGAHILSQGVADERVHGYAYEPLSPESDAQSPRSRSGHFTYGLPYLDVAFVVAAPVPKAKKHPVRRVNVLRLNYYQPSADEVLSTADRSPSEHPERHYMRVRTSSWDGQLAVSIYLNAALQAHFLRLVMRPYILAPIVPDLKFADELAERHPLIVMCMAVAITVRHFGWWIERLHDATSKTDASRKTTPPKSGLRSTREHYAQYYTENMHQTEDSRRIVEVLEQKIFRVTMDYLRQQNIDIGEYESQVLNYFVQTYTVGTGNIITDSTLTNSPVTATGGQGNTAASTSTTSK